MNNAMNNLLDSLERNYLQTQNTLKNMGMVLEQQEIDKACKDFVLEWFKTKAPANSKQPDSEQAQAISSLNKNIQVVARAGSGKTTTIIGRANFLINHCKVDSQSILMLAFNTEAAKEMRERMLKLVGSEDALPHIRTFHSLAYAVANRNAEKKKHIVYDSDEENTYDVKEERKALSQVVQQIIHGMLRRDKEYESRFRRLMDNFFRGVWETIEKGGYNLPEEDQLILRRSIETRTLNNEEVDSIKEKIVADILFEHDVKYSRYIKNGIVKVPLNNKRFIKFKCTDEKKSEEYYQWCLREKNIIVLGPMEFAQGRDYIEQLIGDAITNEGREFIRLSEHEIWGRIQSRAIDDFTKAMTTFVSRARKRDLSIEELSEMIREHKSLIPIEGEFLSLALDVYREYVKYLLDNDWEDFDGLIQRASENIRNGQVLFGKDGDFTEIKHIMIDEYQDFSFLFNSFITTIQKVCPSASLFCVGDDWQAINSFAGSDTKYFNSFCKVYEDSRKYYLKTNYRSCQRIVATSNQLMKRWTEKGTDIKAYRKGSGVVELGHYETFTRSVDEKDIRASDETVAVIRLVRFLLAKNKKVVILFRTRNKLEKGYLSFIRSFFSENDAKMITAYTTHKYKGKEEDAVIVVDALDRKYPLIHPTWMFYRIFDDEYRNSVLKDLSEAVVGDITLRKIEGDERKLFYVALTRAKDNLYILTTKNSKSRFLTPTMEKITKELIWDNYDPSKNDENVITIAIKNNGDEYTTIPISKRLRMEGYSFEKDNKYWYKKVRVNRITDNPVLIEDWVRYAHHVFVEIKDSKGNLISDYVVIRGRLQDLNNAAFENEYVKKNKEEPIIFM